MGDQYSIQNAIEFGWSSIQDQLHPDRRSYLERYVIGDKILDAGCGGGGFVDFLAGRELDVTGIDRERAFLDLAREKRRNGSFVLADISNLPFADGTFDCTYCYDVLEHVHDQQALQELARVTLKRIILTVPKRDEVMRNYGLTFLHYVDKTHLRTYTEGSFAELLACIPHSRVLTFPELPVLTEWLVRDTVHLGLLRVAPIELLGLTLLIGFRELLKCRKPRPKNWYFRARSILEGWLLKNTLYAPVYTGLVAVVDL